MKLSERIRYWVAIRTPNETYEITSKVLLEWLEEAKKLESTANIEGLEQDVKRMLDRNAPIAEAVGYVRSEKGWGLPQAKEFIETIRFHRRMP